MFWKKRQPVTVSPEAKPQDITTEVQKPRKVKKLSPREIITSLIEQLQPGQSLSYRLAKVYGGDLAIVELNPRYPGKGKKYSMIIEALVDGKPSGKRVRLWDADKPSQVASWIVDRQGELFS